MSHHNHRPEHGFTLAEMAIVLLIVSLLLSGLMSSMTSQRELQQRTLTQQRLAEAEEALYGHVLVNGYLPCPASISSQGAELRNIAGDCQAPADALLPWATLGIDSTDGWEHLLRYRVDEKFSTSAAPFTLSTTLSTNIQICDRDSTGTAVSLSNSNIVAAVIYSTGKNSNFAIAKDGITSSNGSAGNTDEQANKNSLTASSGVSFYARITGTTSPGGEFDDQLIWLGLPSLKARMVSAQKLP